MRDITISGAHTWIPTSTGGTLDEHVFIVKAVAGVPHIMSDAMGQAWLEHGVEEMGMLEHWLPELYAREAKGK